MSKQKIILAYYKILWDECLKNHHDISSYEKSIYIDKVDNEDLWSNNFKTKQKITSFEILIEIIDKISAEKITLIDMSKINLIDNALIELVKISNEKERKIIYQNMHYLVSKIDMNFFKTLKNFKKILGNKITQDIFLNLPKEIIKLDRRKGISLSELKENIKTLFPDEDLHPYLLSFLSIRANKMNLSQYGSLGLRDFLIEEYKYDKEKLKDFIPYSLSLEKYLKTDNDGSFFVKKKDAVLIEVIDVEQMKAVVALKNWRTDQYIRALELLMNLYKMKVTGIKKISLIHNKISRKEYYLDLYINLKDEKDLKSVDFQNKLKRFSKVLASGDLFDKQYQYMVNVKNLEKWWNADELSLLLENKDKSIVKKSKL